MIYLEHQYAESGLPRPATIALVVPGGEWLREEVRAEFAHTFPGSQISLHDAEPPLREGADLVVLVSERDDPQVLERAQPYRAQAAVALGLYRVSPRQFDVIPPGGLGGWARTQRRRARLLRFFQRYPRLWRVLERGSGVLCVS